MQLIISYWTLIFKHFWMFLEKIWQYIRMLFDWLFWLFSVSWNYEFISLFSNLFLTFFIIWIVALIVSYIFWDNEIVKEWIWNNKRTSPIKLWLKAALFLILFLFVYVTTDNTIWKIVVNVQWIKEQWFVLNTKEEWFENESWDEFDKKMKMTWWFLNNLNLDSWIFDNSSKDYNYVFREISLSSTKLNFSPEYFKTSWKSVINYSMAILKWNELNTSRWKINMYYVQDLFRNWINNISWDKIEKDQNKEKSWCYWKLENITNYWQDVYSALINNYPQIASEIQENVYIQDTIKDLNTIYSNIKNNYIISSSDSLEKIFDEPKWIDWNYKESIKKMICIWESENWKNEISTIIEKLDEIKTNLLFLERFSEKSNKAIKNDDNKFIFISTILWLDWPLWQSDSSMITRNLRTTEYIQLSEPFVIDIENWDKLINYWICYNYIFNPSIESALKSNWMTNLIQILKSWCWKNFWWVYDYVENDIDRLWVQSYKKIINQVNNSQDSNNEISWKHSWYQYYWNYISSDEEWWYKLSNNNENFKIETNNSNEYKHRISWISWIIKYIHIYKNLIFSLFLYILPWVFIVILLKFIKITSNE